LSTTVERDSILAAPRTDCHHRQPRRHGGSAPAHHVPESAARTAVCVPGLPGFALVQSAAGRTAALAGSSGTEAGGHCRHADSAHPDRRAAATRAGCHP